MGNIKYKQRGVLFVAQYTDESDLESFLTWITRNAIGYDVSIPEGIATIPLKMTEKQQ